MIDEHIEKFSLFNNKKGQKPEENAKTGSANPTEVPATGKETQKRGMMDRVKGVLGAPKPSEQKDDAQKTDGAVNDAVPKANNVASEPPKPEETSAEPVKSVENAAVGTSGAPKEGEQTEKPEVTATSEPQGTPETPQDTPEKGGEGASGDSQDTDAVPEKENPQEGGGEPPQEGENPTQEGEVQQEDPVELDRKQKTQMFLNNLTALSGIAGGVTEFGERTFDVLTNIATNLLSGNPFEIGGQVGESIVQEGAALEPLKTAMAQSLGINERNGTIDQDAAGTLKGKQYYNTKARIDKFYENNEEWLKSELGEGASSENILQYMDEMPDDRFREFAQKYDARMQEEIARIRGKPEGIDKYDEAVIDAYTNVGEKIKAVANTKARARHLEGAMAGTQATLARNQAQQDALDFKEAVDAFRDEVNAKGYRNPRKKVLFNALENKIRGSMGTGKHYIMADGKGGWKINEKMLDYNDWSAIRRDLESIDQKKGLNGAERKLLREMNLKLNNIRRDRAKTRSELNWERSQYSDKKSVIDKRRAAREAMGQYGEDRRADPFGFPDYITDRGSMARDAGFIVDNVKNGLSAYADGASREPMNWSDESWGEYLEKGIPDMTDPYFDEKYDLYIEGLMAQNAMDCINLRDFIGKNKDLSRDARFRQEYQDMRQAAAEVMRHRTLCEGDVRYPYRSGVMEGSYEEAFVDAWNRLVDKHNEIERRAIENDYRKRGVSLSDKKVQENINRMMMPRLEIGTMNDPESIFGPTLQREIPSETSTADRDEYGIETDLDVTSTSKSATPRLDAEGLTYGELFPIVKAKLGTTDEQTDDYIKNNVDNMGTIDSKDDLQKEMSKITQDDVDMYGFGGKKGDTNFNAEGGVQFPLKPVEERTRYDPGKGREVPVQTLYGGNGVSVPSEDDLVSRVIGNVHNLKEQRRRLRDETKRVLTEYGVKDDSEIPSDLAYRLNAYNNWYYKNPEPGRPQTYLYDPNAMRGDIARTYQRIMAASKQREDLTPKAEDVLYRYGLGDGPDKDAYTDAAIELYRNGFDFNPDRFLLDSKGRAYTDRDAQSDRYRTAYGQFARVLDKYRDDPKMQSALNTLWRRYVDDAVVSMASDSEGRVFTDLNKDIIDKMKLKDDKGVLDEESYKRYSDEMNDIIRGRIGALGRGEMTPKADISGSGYINNALRELGEYGKRHITRFQDDRKVEEIRNKLWSNRYLGKLGLTEKDLRDLSEDELSEKVMRAAYAAFNGKKGHKGVGELYMTLKDLMDANKIMYDPEMMDDERFRQSSERWEDLRKLIKSVNKALLRMNTPKTFIGVGNYISGSRSLLPQGTLAEEDEDAARDFGKDFDMRNIDAWLVKDYGLDIPENGAMSYEDTYTAKVALPALRQFIVLSDEDRRNTTNVVREKFIPSIERLDDEGLKRFFGWVSTQFKRADTRQAYLDMRNKDRLDPDEFWNMSEKERRARRLFYSPNTVRENPTMFSIPAKYGDEIKALYKVLKAEYLRRFPQEGA